MLSKFCLLSLITLLLVGQTSLAANRPPPDKPGREFSSKYQRWACRLVFPNAEVTVDINIAEIEPEVLALFQGELAKASARKLNLDRFRTTVEYYLDFPSSQSRNILFGASEYLAIAITKDFLPHLKTQEQLEDLLQEARRQWLELLVTLPSFKNSELQVQSQDDRFAVALGVKLIQVYHMLEAYVKDWAEFQSFRQQQESPDLALNPRTTNFEYIEAQVFVDQAFKKIAGPPPRPSKASDGTPTQTESAIKRRNYEIELAVWRRLTSMDPADWDRNSNIATRFNITAARITEFEKELIRSARDWLTRLMQTDSALGREIERRQNAARDHWRSPL